MFDYKKTTIPLLCSIVIVLFVCSFRLNAFVVDEEQNAKISELQKRIKSLEGKLKEQENKGSVNVSVSPIVAVSTISTQVVPAKDEYKEKIEALEKKITDMDAAIKQTKPNVESGKGSIKISGLIQTIFSYDPNKTARTDFLLKRTRLILSGIIVPDKIKYQMQAELNTTTSKPTPILDAKVQFLYIPDIDICIGRFNPSFTYYMPNSAAKLDFINYPKLITKYGMLRQMGIQSTLKSKYADLNLGIFNGYPSDNYQDTNIDKDLLLGTIIRFSKSISFIASSWLEPSSSLPKNRYTGGLLIDNKIANNVNNSFKCEYLYAADKLNSSRETNGMGFYVQNALKVSQKIEFLGRYDRLDPNLNIKDDTGEETWITGGINYYVEGYNTMFHLNYIHKETMPDKDDDEVALQLQVSFNDMEKDSLPTNENECEIFINTATQHLKIIEIAVENIERHNLNHKMIDGMFRALHCLKASSGYMYFANFIKVLEQHEIIMELIRKDEITISEEIVILFSDCLNKYKELIQTIKESGKDNCEIEGIVERFKKII